MLLQTDKFFEHSCRPDSVNGVCRSRGGESCAFDGAMIVLQCIADAAHLVHGPIGCLGNCWESRGTLSDKGNLHRRAYTTDLSEIEIIYGAEEKLLAAIRETVQDSGARTVFVYATCITGLIGEDLAAVCKKAQSQWGIRAIPVQAPGFIGPKHLGNRIAGEVLLDYVIGTGENYLIGNGRPKVSFSSTDINLIGEYNIAGDLQLVEPVLKRAGIHILSRITGNATFEEITHAHRAKLNVVVCSRALINVACEMEQRYGIPYVEVSFFGKTEMSKALRAIARGLAVTGSHIEERSEAVIEEKERQLKERLTPYDFLRGKKAVLYSGGVKGWSFISALIDLGIEVAAVGTTKSTAEDEEKMRALLGPDAPLHENMAPRNILKLMKEHQAEILIAGGRNQYLAIKEGFPFIDVNQERQTPYAGYEGLANLAEQIRIAWDFYHPSGKRDSNGLSENPLSGGQASSGRAGRAPATEDSPGPLLQIPSGRGSPLEGLGKGSERPNGWDPQGQSSIRPSIIHAAGTLSINPLKHSASIGAAMALQGVDMATVVLHGAQGCNFLGKVLLTKHFREPISMVSTKLFVEEVVMEGSERLAKTLREVLEKNGPEVVGILSTGLTEVRGEDIGMTLKEFWDGQATLLHIPTPDYRGGLEEGYAAAVERLVSLAVPAERVDKRINLLAGSHLTPADVNELRDTIEAFGLETVILPDLSALDGSREGFSPLAVGGTPISAIRSMGQARLTLVIGPSLTRAGELLLQRCHIPLVVLESTTGLAASDRLYRLLSEVSGCEIPSRYRRQRRVLVDGMRDAMVRWGKKRIALAQEADAALALSALSEEMGAVVPLAVVPTEAASIGQIRAEEVVVGDFHCLSGDASFSLTFSVRESLPGGFGIGSNCLSHCFSSLRGHSADGGIPRGLGLSARAYEGPFDLLIASSHGAQTAEELGIPHFEWGFPVFERLGINSSVTVGYRGTLQMVNQIGNAFKQG